MMGWFTAIFDPVERCERKGHKWGVERRSGFRWPSESYRGVADEVTEERECCRRCGDVLSDWQERDRDTLHGLTMDTDRWDKLRRTGFLQSGHTTWERQP